MKLRAIATKSSFGLYDESGTRIATLSTSQLHQESRAQTIAHRVNVHDELVAALEFTQKKLFNMTTEEFRNGGDTTIRATIAIALERANP